MARNELHEQRNVQMVEIEVEYEGDLRTRARHTPSGCELITAGKSVSWRRGRMEVNIKTGDNDLGEITVAPSLFE